MSKKIEFKGIQYESLTALHQAKAVRGLSYSTLITRLRNGWPIDKALSRPPRYQSAARLPKPIQFDGQEYADLADLAKAVGLPHHLLERLGVGPRLRDTPGRLAR